MAMGISKTLRSLPALSEMNAAGLPGFSSLSRPLWLLTALLRANPGPLPSLNHDEWDKFAGLVIDRHRVAPVIAVGLAASGLVLPDAVLARIEAEARANGYVALVHKAETGRLLTALDARG
jgi:hypothetical protein